MENARVICETDAEVLLEFVQLKDSGFLFKYEKTDALRVIFLCQKHQ